jgi:hypothetical protein
MHDLATHGAEVLLQDFTDTARAEALLLGTQQA